MEKQPVDDLFARKLRDAEAPVSPDVFSQLQKRMGAQPLPVRRPLVAWWHVASAACLLLVLGFLYVRTQRVQHVEVPLAYKHVPKKLDHATKNDNSLTDRPVIESKRHEDIIVKTEKEQPSVQATYPAQKSATLTNRTVAKDQAPVQSQPVPELVAVSQQQEIQPHPATPIAAIKTTPGGQVDDRQKQMAERTIVLTIAEPGEPTGLVPDAKNDSPAQQTHQNGLAGLFGKIKQLKSGETLAKAPLATNPNTQRNRFGRVLTEVKESLKNETTLE